MNNTTGSLLLECIDGKDDHLIIEIANGQSILLSGTETEGSRSIKELEGGEGGILLTNSNGILQVDATSAASLVKINGFAITKGTLKVTDLLRIGNSVWKSGSADNTLVTETLTGNKTIQQHFGGMLGLEGLTDFKLKHVFSSVFKKHTLAETEEQLITGTSKNIPSIIDIETGWARPWLFSRFILIAAILAAVLIVGFRMYENPNLIPGIIFVGAFAMPIGSLIFFMEMNAPRNISIFLVFLLVFVGGVASLIITILIHSKLEFISKTFGAAGAAFVEEPAKLLMVIWVMGRYSRYKWLLNGLLFGAAVGTGFAAFESAGYAFMDMVGPLLEGKGFQFEAGVNSIEARGLLAPLTHVVWTANAAGALWLVKGERKFSWSMVKDIRFLRILLSSMVCHFIWNSNFGILRIPVFVDLKYLLLGILGWTICLMLIQTGLKQLNAARQLEIDRLRAS